MSYRTTISGCKCSHFIKSFVFPVSETGQRRGEGETEIGRDSQLCGQGKGTSLPFAQKGYITFLKI